ncbi:hypothetical protein RYH80_18030 [Halobaculum sp. MBLA0147]|uniref:hypothetical protein n=1 Tax=Halobaculum sp. MBLA0147 TaxID=3079934 RepID=UPI00352614F6
MPHDAPGDSDNQTRIELSRSELRAKTTDYTYLGRTLDGAVYHLSPHLGPDGVAVIWKLTGPDGEIVDMEAVKSDPHSQRDRTLEFVEEIDDTVGWEECRYSGPEWVENLAAAITSHTPQNTNADTETQP